MVTDDRYLLDTEVKAITKSVKDCDVTGTIKLVNKILMRVLGVKECQYCRGRGKVFDLDSSDFATCPKCEGRMVI